MLQFVGLQKVRDDWVTELNWTEKVALDMVTSSLGSIGTIIQTECNVFLLMKLLMCPLY